LEFKLNLDETQAASLYIYDRKIDKYNNFMEMLAVCNIFHGGEIQQKFHKEITENRQFINKFDMAKLDYESKSVSFLHRSFAEYLIARLFLRTQKTSLLDIQHLRCILHEEEYSKIRKHVCSILGATPTVKLNFASDVFNGDEQKCLQRLIREDCNELYLLLKKSEVVKLLTE
jgi:hypothetical protein